MALVLIGHVRDADGFQGTLMEDEDTGERSIAYEPQIIWQKNELAKLRAARPQSHRRKYPCPSESLRYCWPPKLHRHKEWRP